MTRSTIKLLSTTMQGCSVMLIQMFTLCVHLYSIVFNVVEVTKMKRDFKPKYRKGYVSQAGGLWPS